MIYMRATLNLLPGKLQEFSELMAKEFAPSAEKHGMKLVAAWQTVFGLQDEVTNLWSFESLSHLDQAFRSMAKDPQWSGLVTRVRSLAHGANIEVLRSLPFSPMK